MAVLIGLNAKMYRGASGAKAAVEMFNVKDVTLNMSKAEADISSRASSGWKTSVATLREASVDFDMVWTEGDADLAAITDSFFNGTVIALYISDGGISPQGLDADFVITNISKSEPLSDAQTIKVTAKPTMETRAPAWN